MIYEAESQYAHNGASLSWKDLLSRHQSWQRSATIFRKNGDYQLLFVRLIGEAFTKHGSLDWMQRTAIQTGLEASLRREGVFEINRRNVQGPVFLPATICFLWK
jgi:hypothetical protein